MDKINWFIDSIIIFGPIAFTILLASLMFVILYIVELVYERRERKRMKKMKKYEIDMDELNKAAKDYFVNKE